MKQKQAKSFTFKVAETNDKKTSQIKARDGVAVAGCTLVQYPWGKEPMTDLVIGGDGPVWC